MGNEMDQKQLQAMVGELAKNGQDLNLWPSGY